MEGNKQGIEVLINFLDNIYLRKADVKKRKVPIMFPENVESLLIPDMSVKSDGMQEVTQTQTEEQKMPWGSRM